jgi:hypothetical protein
MRRLQTICIVSLSILLFACCKTLQFPPTKEKAQQLKAMQKQLDAAKTDVKNRWLSSVHSVKGWKWFKESYNEELSDADIPLMSMVAAPAFRMDSVSFYSFHTNADIVNSLNLETQRADFFVLLNGAFVALSRSQNRGNGWDGGGYSGIYAGIAQKIYQLYARGISVYSLYIYYYRTDDPSVWEFYNNGKRLMSIHSDGSESPLIEDLNKRRKELLEWYKLHKK